MIRALFILLVVCVTASAQVSLPHRRTVFRRGAAAGGASFAEVQQTNYAGTTARASHTNQFANTPTQGSLLVALVVADAYTNAASLPTWSNKAVEAPDFTGTYIFYKIAGAAESKEFVVNLNDTVLCGIVLYEFSGIDATPLDKTASAVNQSASVSTGTTATTAQGDELLIALVGISNGGATMRNITAWSNSFTEQANFLVNGTGTDVRLGTATRVVTATGTYTTTASLDAATSDASGAIATFKISNP